MSHKNTKKDIESIEIYRSFTFFEVTDEVME